MGDDQGPTIRRRMRGTSRQQRAERRALTRALRALPDGAVFVLPAGAEVRMLAPGGAS